jgi:hypothetical protein
LAERAYLDVQNDLVMDRWPYGWILPQAANRLVDLFDRILSFAARRNNLQRMDK